MEFLLRSIAAGRPVRASVLAMLACASLVASLLAPAVVLADASSLSWTDTTLASMKVGVPFADGVSADGSPAATYSVSAGSLPDGLALDGATGAVTGSPTTAGAYSFSITAANGTDSLGLDLTGIVGPADAPPTEAPPTEAPPTEAPPTEAPPTSSPTDAPPSWIHRVLAPMKVGVAFTGGVSAEGSPAPTYSITAGALPDGLTLDAATGAVTGTPTTAGAYTVTITASNGVGDAITAAITGNVAPPGTTGNTLDWTDTTVPTLRVGAYVDFYVQASSDADSPSYSITAGSLPVGLRFDNGEIWGAPSSEGPYDFTVTASNGSDPDITHQFTGTVGAEGSAPVWVDTTITEMYLGIAVNDGVSATGDSTPTYYVNGGSLPDGVLLDEDTGAITGTPTREEYYNVEICAENEYDTICLSFERRTWPTPADNAPYWADMTIGPMYATVAFSDGVAANGTPAPTYSVTTGTLPDGLELDPDTGAITGTPTADGAFDFTVTAANGVDPAADVEFAGDVYAAPRGCASYTGKSYVGALVLNSDGTPVGCGTDAAHGAATDLTPAGWANAWNSTYGTDTGNEVTYTQRLGWACDDCWVGAHGYDSSAGLPIGFPINFYGTTYTTVFVNSNGSIAFGHGSDEYDTPLNEILDGAAGVVAFGVDLDNRVLRDADSSWGSDRHADFFYWGRTTYNGHAAFVATWMNMNGYSSGLDSTDFDTFQIVLVDVDGAGGSNVDIIVNYGSLGTNFKGYDCEDAAGNSYDNCLAIGLGTVQNGVTRYASMVDDAGVLYNGMSSDAVIDGGDNALNLAHLNSTVHGQFKFQMRIGQLPQTATVPGVPTITAVSAGDSLGTVDWAAPTDTGNSPILSYNLRWRVAGSTDDWSTDNTGSGPFEMDGLTNDTQYEVQVAAVNGVGAGDWSDLAYFTPGTSGIAIPVTETGPGGTIHVTGWGFMPGSDVGIYLHSVPVLLLTVTADGDGYISADVTIPSGTALGAHAIYLEGIDASENDLELHEGITINSGVTPPPTLTGTRSGPARGGSALPLVSGLGLLAGAFALVLVARRRQLDN
jgi:hypothetical protein